MNYSGVRSFSTKIDNGDVVAILRYNSDVIELM